MNAALEYLYRDAGNDKQWGRVVFANPESLALEVAEARLCAACDSHEFFVARQVNLEELYFEDFDDELDHGFHQFSKLEPTTDVTTDTRTLTQFVEEFVRAGAPGASGWTITEDRWDPEAAEWQTVIDRLKQGLIKGPDGKALKPPKVERGKSRTPAQPARRKASDSPRRAGVNRTRKRKKGAPPARP